VMPPDWEKFLPFFSSFNKFLLSSSVLSILLTFLPRILSFVAVMRSLESCWIQIDCINQALNLETMTAAHIPPNVLTYFLNLNEIICPAKWQEDLSESCNWGSCSTLFCHHLCICNSVLCCHHICIYNYLAKIVEHHMSCNYNNEQRLWVFENRVLRRIFVPKHREIGSR
jgi:hypothetical protein